MTRHPEQPGSSEWAWSNNQAFDQNRITTDSHVAGLPAAPAQRPMMPPSFMANDPYSAAPPMASMPVASFPPYSYAPYSQPLTSMVPPTNGYPITDSDLKQEASPRHHHHHQQQLPSPSHPQRLDTLARPAPSPRSHEYGAVLPDRGQDTKREHEQANTRPSTEVTVTPKTSIDIVVKLTQDNPDKMRAIMGKLEHMSIAPTSPGSPQQAVVIKGRRYKAPQELKFACTFGCGKKFKQRAQRTTHERIHTGHKPFECHYEGCGKSYRQAGNLTTHIRGHTGERNYHCNICSKTFASGGGLHAHRKTHSGERLDCLLDGCDKSYSNTGNLKSHQVKVHSAYMQQLWTRWASTDNPAKDLTPEDQCAFLRLAKVHRHSNQGITGRGKGNHVKRYADPHQFSHRRGSTTSTGTDGLSPVSTPASSPTYASSCSPSPILADLPEGHHYPHFHPTFPMAGPAHPHMSHHQQVQGLVHPSLAMGVRYDFAHRDAYPPRNDFTPRSDFPPREY